MLFFTTRDYLADYLALPMKDDIPENNIVGEVAESKTEFEGNPFLALYNEGKPIFQKANGELTLKTKQLRFRDPELSIAFESDEEIALTIKALQNLLSQKLYTNGEKEVGTVGKVLLKFNKGGY